MPLTDFQQRLLAALSANKSGDRYLAGGAALHFTPESARFSNDLDFFADSVERVATAFAADHALLDAAGYVTEIEVSQPGFIRTVVRRGNDATRVDWAHDSAWRFLPLVRDAAGGLMLHPLDLAINKVLALAGRDEPRDFVDILYVTRHILPLGALIWAAVGKDPGFAPLSLLELLRRRGRPRPEEIARLALAEPFDVVRAKEEWLAALEEAERFVRSRPPDDAGCLYYSRRTNAFVAPESANAEADPQADIVRHFGRPGGVLPRVT